MSEQFVGSIFPAMASGPGFGGAKGIPRGLIVYKPR